MNKAPKKALFLDRDGVINVDHGYTYRIEDFHFVEGILDFIRIMQERGYLPIVVTNQSGIGRGYYRSEDFERLTEEMLRRMRDAGIAIERAQVFACPHAPEEGCSCRKPEPGMFLQAAERFELDLASSLLFGDKLSDIQAGRAAGVGHCCLVTPNQPIPKELYGF